MPNYIDLSNESRRAAIHIMKAASKLKLTDHDVDHVMRWASEDFHFEENGANDVKVTQKMIDAAEVEDGRWNLVQLLQSNPKIYHSLKHVSDSGMSRRISFFTVHKGSIQNVDYYIGLLLGYKRHDKGGLTITGAGMDMGFHVVSGVADKLGFEISSEWI